MKLGYTKKWIKFNFLTEDILSSQVAEFEKSKDQNTEHYRYASFVSWLERKDSFSNKEIYNYIELAKDDADDRMAGAAMKDLFVSPKLSYEQFELMRLNLPQFGKWTEKLISREVLSRRIKTEEITSDLFNLCYEYKIKHKDNRLLISIIKNTDNVDLLSVFSELDIGKKIKTLASNKLNRLERQIS